MGPSTGDVMTEFFAHHRYTEAMTNAKEELV